MVVNRFFAIAMLDTLLKYTLIYMFLIYTVRVCKTNFWKRRSILSYLTRWVLVSKVSYSNVVSKPTAILSWQLSIRFSAPGKSERPTVLHISVFFFCSSHIFDLI